MRSLQSISTVNFENVVTLCGWSESVHSEDLNFCRVDRGIELEPYTKFQKCTDLITTSTFLKLFTSSREVPEYMWVDLTDLCVAN